jgi:hypothetical protein
MNTVNFSTMTAPALVDFYNRHSMKPVKRFSDRKAAERRCTELFESLKSSSPEKVMNQKSTELRPAMKTSLKLDRRIQCEETGEQWKNAHQMWKDNPGYMTSGQQDRLTAQLYIAAKQGMRIVVKVNDLNFSLVSVTGVN